MKIIPIPDCPPPDFVLLEKQIREEIIKCFAIPEHLLKPKKVFTAQEILLTSQSTRPKGARPD